MMKRLFFLFLILMIFLAGCSTEPEKNGENVDNKNSVERLRSYIAQSEGSSDVKAYMDQLLKGADTETSDALVLEYLLYMEAILSENQPDAKDFPEDAGFKFVTGEGGDYPVIDYHFLDEYSGQISQEITDFAIFMALNSDAPWAMDAGIIIPIRDLADRVALAEQFMSDYPDSALKDTVLVQYGYYLGSLLAGLDNTPLFSWQTYKAEPEFIDAYDYFLKTYPNMVTAETVADFQTELEQMNYTAPYTYSEHEKRAAFSDYIYELVEDTSKQFAR